VKVVYRCTSICGAKCNAHFVKNFLISAKNFLNWFITKIKDAFFLNGVEYFSTMCETTESLSLTAVGTGTVADVMSCLTECVTLYAIRVFRRKLEKCHMQV